MRTPTAIERCLRNASTIRWLDAAEGSYVVPLPGTNDTLRTLQLGFASYLQIPVDEVDILYPCAEVLSWVYLRYGSIIEAWIDSQL